MSKSSKTVSLLLDDVAYTVIEAGAALHHAEEGAKLRDMREPIGAAVDWEAARKSFGEAVRILTHAQALCRRQADAARKEAGFK